MVSIKVRTSYIDSTISSKNISRLCSSLGDMGYTDRMLDVYYEDGAYYGCIRYDTEDECWKVNSGNQRWNTVRRSRKGFCKTTEDDIMCQLRKTSWLTPLELLSSIGICRNNTSVKTMWSILRNMEDEGKIKSKRYQSNTYWGAV